MKLLFLMPFILLFSGCTFSVISLSGTQNINFISNQYYENQKCLYSVGPFSVSKVNINDLNLLIEDTIKKANEDGLNGDTLMNIKIVQSGYSLILFSKYCRTIQGNLIYKK